MDKENYRKRIIDKTVAEYLSMFGAVCIEGPKWCGKTWTSSFHCSSEIFMGDPSGNFQNRQLAQMSPNLILDGKTPRLIDEWQEVPPIWDAVRYEVDRRGKNGQFILTGSATPNHKGIMHSGAGRIAKIRMHTMSLYESGDSSGVVSLSELCRGIFTPSMTGEVSLKNIIELIIRGGWPGSLGGGIYESPVLANEYLNAVIDDDVYRIDGIRRDSVKMRLLLRSLARNESTTASNNTLVNDIKIIDDGEVDSNTVGAYLDVFNRLFITENQPPFSSGIRSSVRIKQAEKRHFTDPSLACALLNVTAESLLNDLETLGFLFESLCERDLRIYAQSFGGKLYHYQDYKNNEIDAVVELPDGNWCAFEIKLGANQIDSAAENLIKISEQIREEPKGKPPVLLGVICGLSNASYQRPDGVYVIPITALKD